MSSSTVPNHYKVGIEWLAKKFDATEILLLEGSGDIEIPFASGHSLVKDVVTSIGTWICNPSVSPDEVSYLVNLYLKPQLEKFKAKDANDQLGKLIIGKNH